jgi:hypothetical protein
VSAAAVNPWHETTWDVVSYREAVYQACPGAPVQSGGSCEKCGQGIRYVVTLKGADGRLVEVGRDCAETVLGGEALAKIRTAERRYQDEQYRASPEYAARKAREETAAAARAERAAEAEERYALDLHGLRAIVASPACSGFEHDQAALEIRHIAEGDSNGAEGWDDRRREWLATAVWRALFAAQRPAPRHHSAAPGTRLRGVPAVLARTASYEGGYGWVYVLTFVTDAGEVLVWKGSGAWKTRDDGTVQPYRIGERVRLTGTVKAHGEYNGQPQTYVSRCKLEVA